MVASLLAPLALLAAVASAADEADQVAQLREGCQAMLRGLSSSGMPEVEVKMECRARLPPGLCRSGLAELGAQPWPEDRVAAACGTMTRDVERSIESLPRELQNQAYAEMNAQVEQCLQAKQKMAANPIKVNGKPLTVNFKGLVVEVTLILKILESFKMTDIMNKYYTCQEKHCAPTTTPKPVDPLSIFLAHIKDESKKESSPFHLPSPSQKFEEVEVSDAVQHSTAFVASACLPLFVGGSVVAAVAAFVANHIRRRRRAMSVLSDGDDEAEDHE